MKRVKKLICVMLVCGMLLSVFAGCSSSRELISDEPETTTSASKTEKTTKSSSEETTDPAEQEEADYVTNNPIDRAYDEAIKNIRNFAKYEITQDYSQKWKKEMETNLEKLSEKLSPEHKKLLASAQNDWEDYIKTELKFGYAYSDILELSSDDEMQHNAECYYKAYRERAIQLYQYIQMITEKYGDVPYFEAEEEETEEE